MIITKDLDKILKIGIALTSEKDYNKLLELILTESMNITHCDGGTLYVLEKDALRFKIMRNDSMGTYSGGGGEAVNLPPVPLREENVCAYSAIHREVINIEDVYTSEKFDFKGPKKYDEINGYRTKSLLVIPLISHENDVLGVIQLINALDDDNKVVPFDPVFEFIIFSLASEATITLANMKYMNDMSMLLDSMVRTFTAAIDERTPYNANHTNNVASYSKEVLKYLDSECKAGRSELSFTKDYAEQVVMAAKLHDIGKLITPIEIINKSTRLGESLPKVLTRFELVECKLKIDMFEGMISKEEFEREEAYIVSARELIKRVDALGFLDDETVAQIEELAKKEYEVRNIETGELEKVKLITDTEHEQLLIRRGTLTAGERKVVEEHVSITARLLEKVYFGNKLKDVPAIASAHHEYIDGSGYPKGLKGDEIPEGSKLLTVLDIFDSLISTDRPYKKPMPIDRAIKILYEMVDEGKLDIRYVKALDSYIRTKDVVI